MNEENEFDLSSITIQDAFRIADYTAPKMIVIGRREGEEDVVWGGIDDDGDEYVFNQAKNPYGWGWNSNEDGYELETLKRNDITVSNCFHPLPDVVLERLNIIQYQTNLKSNLERYRDIRNKRSATIYDVYDDDQLRAVYNPIWTTNPCSERMITKVTG